MCEIVNSRRGQTRSWKSVAGRKVVAEGGRAGSMAGTRSGVVLLPCRGSSSGPRAASMFQLDTGLLPRMTYCTASVFPDRSCITLQHRST